MAQFDPILLSTLAAPMNRVASLLKQSPNQLVPFKIGSIKAALNAPTGAPSVSISAIPLILGVIGGPATTNLPQVLGDAIVHLITFNVPSLLTDLTGVAADVAGIITQQASVALSLLTILANLPDNEAKSIGKAVADAYQQYFFGTNGYQTLEGAAITPPSLQPVSGNPASVSDLRKFTSLQTAEQYTRNLVQITAEAAGNQLFDLVARYAYLAAKPDTIQQWFRGYSSLAESTVTSAIEETLLGIGTFSTNPIFAAAVGTFAGTAARKATQSAFLSDIGVAL